MSVVSELCVKINVMQGKYITTQIRLASHTRKKTHQNDIHLELKKTLEERAKILAKFNWPLK